MLRQFMFSSLLLGLFGITLPLLARAMIHTPPHASGQIDILSLSVDH